MSELYRVVEMWCLTRVLLIQTHSLLFLRRSPLPGEMQCSPLFLTRLSLLPERSAHGRQNFLGPTEAAVASCIPLATKCFVANPRGLARSSRAPGSALPRLSTCCWASCTPWVVGWGLPTPGPAPGHSNSSIPSCLRCVPGSSPAAEEPAWAAMEDAHRPWLRVLMRASLPLPDQLWWELDPFLLCSPPD